MSKDHDDTAPIVDGMEVSEIAKWAQSIFSQLEKVELQTLERTWKFRKNIVVELLFLLIDHNIEVDSYGEIEEVICQDIRRGIKSLKDHEKSI